MSGSDDKPEKPANPAKPGGREARLAAALRENLRRRKAQERGREARASEPDEGPSDGGKR